MPSLETLRCFIAATNAKSFRAAAKQVALTPAAFGQRIRQLEEQVGLPLFARTTRSMELTAAGRALIEKAKVTVEAAEACLRIGETKETDLPLELTLGTRYELGLSYLLPLHAKIVQRMPALTLHFYFGSGPDLLNRVRSREIAAAITSSRISETALDFIPLHREDYVFVGAAKLLKRVPLQRPEHAADHTLIDAGTDLPLFRYWQDGGGWQDQLELRRTLVFGSSEACRRMVLEGLGVGVLPLYMVATDLKRGRLRRLFPAVAAKSDFFRFIFRADTPHRPAFERICATLAESPLR
ncbi:MAG: LysR family transcriptional regulator [Myxococcaceae bacterium]